MARKLRLVYAGAICHVMSRGDRREAIFRDDEDREGFLNALGEVCEKAGGGTRAVPDGESLSRGGRRSVWRGAPKGARIKVAMAARLRAETLVSVKWIAARLHVGTAGYVNNRLYCWRKGLLD